MVRPLVALVPLLPLAPVLVPNSTISYPPDRCPGDDLLLPDDFQLFGDRILSQPAPCKD